MRHCIVVMFADAEKPAYSTGWMERGEAFYKVTKEPELTKARVAWVGWSYYYRHRMADSMIENELRDLAKSLINSYHNNVTHRKMVKIYNTLFNNPVYVLKEEITETEVFGFAYAQCIWKGAPASDSGMVQSGSHNEGAVAS